MTSGIVLLISDAMKPLLRHLVATPVGTVPPSRVVAFVEAVQAAGEGADPATVRRLAQDHFGDLTTDVDAIATRVIKFTQNASGGMDDAAFLTLDDLVKPGNQGFLIPEIDRVYQRWLRDNKEAIKNGTLDGSPKNWVDNHMSTRDGLRHRTILEALLGPAALRQAAPPRATRTVSGWRVRPRVDKPVTATAVQDLVGMVMGPPRAWDNWNVGDVPPAPIETAVRRLYDERGMTDPPSVEDTITAMRDYIGFFAAKSNRFKTVASEQIQIGYLKELAGDATKLEDAVRRLYAARDVTDQAQINTAIQEVTQYLDDFAGQSKPSLNGLPEDVGGVLSQYHHVVGHTEFDATTAAYISGGRTMHPDDFLHNLMDGFELFNAVERSNDLTSMVDLSEVTDDLAEIMRYPFSGKGGRNTHGYVYEVAIVIQRTVRDGTDEAGLVWKHIQVKIGGAEGPDMIEMFAGPPPRARYVQVKSYNDAGRLIGQRSEILRQTGSDIVRTWDNMDPAHKGPDGGPLRIFVKPDAGAVNKVWADVDERKVWGIDRDRLMSRYQAPVTDAEKAAFAAKQAAEEARIQNFADGYNDLIENGGDVLSDAQFDAFVGEYCGTIGRTSLNGGDILRQLRTANPGMTMRELALARLIMNTKTGKIDTDLLARLAQSGPPWTRIEVEFTSPVGPNKLQTDVRAGLPETTD